jgi:DNA-binding transcriptional ArsR family regulator
MQKVNARSAVSWPFSVSGWRELVRTRPNGPARRGRERGSLDNPRAGRYVTIQLPIIHSHPHSSSPKTMKRNQLATQVGTKLGSGDVDVFRAIADPTRRAILDRLRSGPAPVNTLAADFQQTRPAISKHLKVLRTARLVTEQRAGRERYYQLEPQPLREVAGWVESYRSFWLTSLTQLKRFLEEK